MANDTFPPEFPVSIQQTPNCKPRTCCSVIAAWALGRRLLQQLTDQTQRSRARQPLPLQQAALHLPSIHVATYAASFRTAANPSRLYRLMVAMLSTATCSGTEAALRCPRQGKWRERALRTRWASHSPTHSLPACTATMLQQQTASRGLERVWCRCCCR